MRMTAESVVEAIERERARLLAAIDALGERASTVAVTAEGWTAKDVLAHLSHWATQVAFGLGVQVAPPLYMQEERRRRQLEGESDRMPSGEESNALAVAHYAPVPLTEVRATFEHLVDAILERVRMRNDDDLNAMDAVPWAKGRRLWEFIGGDTFLHWPVHAADIEHALRKD
jgi:hypothetical protein